MIDADWSVITKFGAVLDRMHIDELHLSVPDTVGRPLRCSGARGRRTASHF